MPEDAIGILIDLARRGEIDPWDIDVVQLTDRFLQSLSRLEVSDLPRFGQALFYASLLVHMKAEILEGRMQASEPEEVLEELPPDALETRIATLPLERVLRRRPSVPAMTERPLTLGDLIAHLRAVEQLERRAERERTAERRPVLRGVSVRTMAQVEHLAHAENLEAIVAGLWQLLVETGAGSLEVLLEHYRDRVGAFLGLLFLAHRNRVELAQAEFYRDIAVYVVSESEDPTGSRPVPESTTTQPG